MSTLPPGATIDTDYDGLADEFAAAYAAAIERNRDRWQEMLWTGRGYRRGPVIRTFRSLMDAHHHPNDYAAAVAMIAPYPHDDGAADRQREIISAWSGWSACAQGWRIERAYTAEHGPSPRVLATGSAFDLTGWRAWPGDTVADYDGSTERYNLSPSGQWHHAPPPVYAAGIALLDPIAGRSPRRLPIDPVTHRTTPEYE